MSVLSCALSSSLVRLIAPPPNSLEQTRDLAAHAESVGAAGIATMAPFFFKVSARFDCYHTHTTY
jgi:dihydrodipicolinate synthase/N-acetylneuraminate lyase